MPIDDSALAAFHALQISRPGRKPKLSLHAAARDARAARRRRIAAQHRAGFSCQSGDHMAV